MPRQNALKITSPDKLSSRELLRQFAENEICGRIISMENLIGKTSNKFSNITNTFRKHVWCITAFLGLLSLIALVLWLSRDNSALSHFSLASSLLSIALAVIVVLYTFYQNNNMSNLISSIPKEMENAAHIIKEKTDQLIDTLNDRRLEDYGSPDEKSSAPTPSELIKNQKVNLSLNLSMCSHLTKIAFYCFVSANNLGHRINTKEILIKLNYGLDPINEIAKRTWLTCIFNLISACIRSECTYIGEGGWNVNSLEQDFIDQIKESITNEIDSGNKRLKDDIQKIDEYLESFKN